MEKATGIKGIKKIISHGRILARPAVQPFGTANSVGYDLGKCFQLDRSHCLLVAGMDEQGGGDMSVGNHGFIFEKLSDIRPERAITINAVDPEYKLRYRPGKAFLAKFPATGGFVPLGAKLADGRPHPAAGTGILVSDAYSFNQDRTSADSGSEVIVEVMQLRWDGKSLTVTDRTLIDTALDFRLHGRPFSYFCPQGPDFLAPFVTDQGLVVFQVSFGADGWQFRGHGRPFVTNTVSNWIYAVGESEPSIQRQGSSYLIYTRGADPKGRVYISDDGLNYTLLFDRPNLMVPQALNQGLDGSLYLATNPNWDMLRNPLMVYPMVGQGFGEPMVVYDQDGIRDDKGASVPFVDHGVGVNLFLEGRWRHFLWYRVCDLKERTFHTYMSELNNVFHKDGKPQQRAEFGGLYLAELEYEHIAGQPFQID